MSILTPTQCVRLLFGSERSIADAGELLAVRDRDEASVESLMTDDRDGMNQTVCSSILCI